MKALTLKQPWAALIVNGYKTYEFRSWNTKYRGKILIHAGLSKEKVNPEIDNYNLEYIRGAIIGEAELVDCILIDSNFDKKLRKENPIIYGYNHVGMYAWHLTNVKMYDEPIPAKGQLGLWNYEK